MKLKKDMLLRQVAGNWVAIAVGAASASFSGMLTLNEAGALLWKKLEEGSDEQGLVAALLEEYEVDEPTATADVAKFLQKLRDAGCLED